MALSFAVMYVLYLQPPKPGGLWGTLRARIPIPTLPAIDLGTSSQLLRQTACLENAQHGPGVKDQPRQTTGTLLS